MPIVKIAQKGWETFSGYLEGVKFEDGISLESISLHTAERLGCSMKIVDAETDEPVSSSNRILQARDQSVAPGRLTMTMAEYKASLETEEAPAPTEEPEPAPEPVKKPSYTREQLEAIADNGGITGLREFAKDFNVNGRSIPGIIDALMEKVS